MASRKQNDIDSSDEENSVFSDTEDDELNNETEYDSGDMQEYVLTTVELANDSEDKWNMSQRRGNLHSSGHPGNANSSPWVVVYPNLQLEHHLPQGLQLHTQVIPGIPHHHREKKWNRTLGSNLAKANYVAKMAISGPLLHQTEDLPEPLHATLCHQSQRALCCHNTVWHPHLEGVLSYCWITRLLMKLLNGQLYA